MKKLFNVAKGAFRPPPKVESAVVRLEPLPEILKIDEDLLRRAFSARRKTLRNALPGANFAAAGIDPTLRPENLSPADYAAALDELRSCSRRGLRRRRSRVVPPFTGPGSRVTLPPQVLAPCRRPLHVRHADRDVAEGAAQVVASRRRSCR